MKGGEEFYTRAISSNLTESETLDALTDAEERIFYRLLSQTDMKGRYKGNPEILSSYLFPISRKKSANEIRDALTVFVRSGIIWWYTVGGKLFVEFRNFEKFNSYRKDVSPVVLYPGHEEGELVVTEPSKPEPVQTRTDPDEPVQTRTDPDEPVQTRTDPDEPVQFRADIDIDIDTDTKKETPSSGTGSDDAPLDEDTLPDLVKSIQAVYFCEYGKLITRDDLAIVKELLVHHYPAVIEKELRKVKRNKPRAPFPYIKKTLESWSSRTGPPRVGDRKPDDALTDSEARTLNSGWGG